MYVPVFTLSPTCSSDITTEFPLSRETLAVEGKQTPPRGGGGGGGGGVVGKYPGILKLNFHAYMCKATSFWAINQKLICAELNSYLERFHKNNT